MSSFIDLANDSWVEASFTQADKDNSGTLDKEEIMEIFAKQNLKITKSEVKITRLFDIL